MQEICSSIRRIGCRVVPLALLVWLMAGCTDGYSESLVYPLRTDPIILAVPTQGADAEPDRPDRPGVLPVRTFTQMEQPDFPLYPVIKMNKAVDPRNLTPNDRQVIESSLEEMFGKPAKPKVAKLSGVDGDLVTSDGVEKILKEEIIPELKLDEKRLADGSRLYRKHCLHCHGLTGDGRGPTAYWINPHPRDYRDGVYKFVSTEHHARRDDLMHTLQTGIEGTAMPAFNVLPEQDLEAIVSYVIHLSLRGEVERDIINQLLPQSRLEETLKEGLLARLNAFGLQWVEAQKKTIDPKPYPDSYEKEEEFRESVQRGFQYWVEWQCYTCHKDFGRESTFRYDVWGTLARPANLTTGIYRGGRRPVDLYWRMVTGVNGSGMPKFKDKEGPNPAIKGDNDQVWDMVNLLHVLPYPEMRAKYGINIDKPLPVAAKEKKKEEKTGGQ